MAMHAARCPQCGLKHNYRTSSSETLHTCKGCRTEYMLPKASPFGIPMGLAAGGGALAMFALCGLCMLGAVFGKKETSPAVAKGETVRHVVPGQQTRVEGRRPPRTEVDPETAKREAEERAKQEEAARLKREEEAAARKAKEEAEKAAAAKKEAEELAKKNELTATAKLKIAKKLSDPDAYARKLKEIVDMFPDTEAAKEARTLLGKK